MRQLQVVVVPFNRMKGEFVPAGHEPARSPEAGRARASALAGRYTGVGVYGVWVDDETMDASDLHELAQFGQVPNLAALQAAA